MRTFTATDLTLGTIVAASFVVMFRLQRAAYPDYYFAFGELICGLKASIAPLAFVLRVGLIFGFAVAWFALLRRSFPVYYGVGLGSLLIVWPAIVTPFQVEPLLQHRRKWLLLTYALFVVFSLLLARGAELVYRAMAGYIPAYVATWQDPARVITLVGDTVVVSALLPVVGLALWRLLAWLKTEFAVAASEMDQEMADYLYETESDGDE